jgi:hypothetical protein
MQGEKTRTEFIQANFLASKIVLSTFGLLFGSLCLAETEFSSPEKFPGNSALSPIERINKPPAIPPEKKKPIDVFIPAPLPDLVVHQELGFRLRNCELVLTIQNLGGGIPIEQFNQAKLYLWVRMDRGEPTVDPLILREIDPRGRLVQSNSTLIYRTGIQVYGRRWVADLDLDPENVIDEIDKSNGDVTISGDTPADCN